ncbi:MAG: transglutaminase family protein [Oceanospirillaceae bacterium]|uniref:transglutaminase family protein n=1 Tax=Marinobacterium litorale TaxID=404770 RepID=UPI0003F691C8|nr:transglutaminase family protein [Marinobacterium litorale]MBS97332.1 transglutaminase family protein [Oceanospirillaceae bacterium]
MIYRIRHLTKYEYANPVSLCYNRAHLLPRDTQRQQCLSTQIRITPTPVYSVRREDFYANLYYYFSIQEPHSSLQIDVTSQIKIIQPTLNFDLDLGNSCARALELTRSAVDEETLLAREFCLDSPMIRATDVIREYAAPSFSEDRPLLSAVRELTTRIYTDFKYDPGFSNVATPLHAVLEHRRGVCQDFAHLAIACLRSLGFAARYVSGYLETLPPPGQQKLIGSDASHAWFAVYSPGEGWFEFDPTNDNMPAEQHITTAIGRDYGDVTPLRGVIFDGGGSQKLSVSVDVAALPDT